MVGVRRSDPSSLSILIDQSVAQCGGPRCSRARPEKLVDLPFFLLSSFTTIEQTTTNLSPGSNCFIVPDAPRHDLNP